MRTLGISHRRNRQQTRRVLAEFCVRWRDLNASGFVREFDAVVHHDDQLVIPSPTTFVRNRA